MMRIRIVSYEDINAWILGKFARKLRDELLLLGIDVDISQDPDPYADINHHIIYLGYKMDRATKCDTLMVTHVDDDRKLELLKAQLSHAKAGICMSSSIIPDLVNLGIEAGKLCYVNPAHDGIIKPRQLVVGITSKVQPDGCKREDMLLTLSNHISPDFFKFKIMGQGWDEIVQTLETKGFTVEYSPEFDYDGYTKLIPSLDYFLYFGLEQGSMGFMDALSAGVATIVPPDGYHNDAPGGIVHPFVTNDELLAVFKSISESRQLLINSVATWTWRDYAIKHLEIWEAIVDPGIDVKSKYTDGVNSLGGYATGPHASTYRRFKLKYLMYASGINKRIYQLKKIKNFRTFWSLIKNTLRFKR